MFIISAIFNIAVIPLSAIPLEFLVLVAPSRYPELTVWSLMGEPKSNSSNQLGSLDYVLYLTTLVCTIVAQLIFYGDECMCIQYLWYCMLILKWSYSENHGELYRGDKKSECTGAN